MKLTLLKNFKSLLMENPSAILYLIIGIGCLYLYRILKKKWNIQSSSKSSLFKMLFKNLNNKNK